MRRPPVHPVSVGVWALLALGLGCSESGAVASPLSDSERAVPVETGAVERGPLTYRRTVSGSLEAAAEFVVAAKVGGRIVRLDVDLSDPVERGQVVARLEADEFEQAVQQAEADLAVARASHAEAEGALEIAQRALERLKTLRTDGVASESQLDAALADEIASRAHLEVTAAGVARAEAALRSAHIRLAYCTVTADWPGADEVRVVGERFVDEGGTAPPNAALLSVVQLDPIIAVVFVAERDYRLLSVDQRATLATDAFPDRTFEGRVVRIAPVFQSATRQARVEVELENPSGALKPGMFVRATLELDHVADATSVPVAAVTERGGADAVLLLEESGDHVRWVEVRLGIREGERVQVLEPPIEGRVVTLGQELCDDGALVEVVDAHPDPEAR